MLALIIFLIILFLIFRGLWKAINTYPMQAELDRINNTKTFWEILLEDRSYRGRCVFHLCDICMLINKGCPLEGSNVPKKWSANYCPAQVRKEFEVFE